MALRNFKSLLPNHLIHPEANLPQGEKTQDDKVIGRTKDPNYDTVVKQNDNPLFNSVLYDVEFPDGKIK